MTHKHGEPKFSLGNVFITSNGSDLVRSGRLQLQEYLDRHMAGDWGDCSEIEKKFNDEALSAGSGRLFSVYHVDAKITLWVITETDPRSTMILLPYEY